VSTKLAYERGDLQVRFVERRVFLKDQEVALSAREFAVLVHLARNAGKIRSVAEIFESVWRRPLVDESAYVWTYIRRLRQKLEADPGRPEHVLTQGNRGYLMP